MSTLVEEATRVLQITLPEQLAQRVEALALEQETNVNELVQWTIRLYLHRLANKEEEFNAPIDPSDPESMSMAQVNALVRQVRREQKTA